MAILHHGYSVTMSKPRTEDGQREDLVAYELVTERGTDARRHAHDMVQAAILKGDKKEEARWLRIYLDVDGLLAHRGQPQTWG
ncbi:hypothetical protein [Roseomonas populi]|uniref:Uncharacterized protein n=1 Tax=Roseomonas populi TaxID=3121582 RepID=A0ABT1XAY9_9PROT|nr:hypothetical protein [Roseomonas pecuniae]MCR0985272.1 hypothetical protein [Roseomonas pecuniae]